MATLNYTEKRKLEEFLGMGSGYVLDFSNRAFREFIHDGVGMDIDDPHVGGSGSKAWRLRHFWSEQPDYVVGKLLKDMIESVTVEFTGPLNAAVKMRRHRASQPCYQCPSIESGSSEGIK